MAYAALRPIRRAAPTTRGPLVHARCRSVCSETGLQPAGHPRRLRAPIRASRRFNERASPLLGRGMLMTICRLAVGVIFRRRSMHFFRDEGERLCLQE